MCLKSVLYSVLVHSMYSTHSSSSYSVSVGVPILRKDAMLVSNFIELSNQQPCPPPPRPPMTNTRWGSGRLRDSIAANQTTFSLTIRKLYLKKKGEKGGQDTRRVFTAIFSIIIFRFDAYRKGLLFTYCF